MDMIATIFDIAMDTIIVTSSPRPGPGGQKTKRRTDAITVSFTTSTRTSYAMAFPARFFGNASSPRQTSSEVPVIEE
jgi:hypothetical protein